MLSKPLGRLCAAACVALVPLAGEASGWSEEKPDKRAAPSSPSSARRLELGHRVSGELSGGAVQAFAVALEVGQFVHLVVEQKGLDVSVALLAPAGTALATADHVGGVDGREEVLHVADQAGEHRIELRAARPDARAGAYEIWIQEMRPSGDEDRKRAAAQSKLFDGDRLRAEGTAESLSKAVESYREAATILRALGDGPREAAALLSLGETLTPLGEQSAALEAFQRALSLFEASGDSIRQAEALNNIGVVHFSKGEHRVALQHVERAVELLRAAGDPLRLAHSLHNLGKLHEHLGEPRKALEYYDQALPAFEAAADPSALGTIYQSIGAAEYLLGNWSQARERFLQALPLHREARDRTGESYTLSNLAQVYGSWGEYQRALEHCALALSLLREPGNPYGEALLQSNMGKLFFELGDGATALERLEIAVSLSRKVQDQRGEAFALANIGFIQRRAGDRATALQTQRQALELWQKIGDRRGEALTLSQLAILHAETGDFGTAVDELSRALEMNRAIPDPEGEAASLHGLARVQALRGQADVARELFERSLTLWRKLGDRAQQADVSYRLALLSWGRGDISEARRHLTSALGLAEFLRVGAASPEHRASYLASVRDFYELEVDLLMAMHRREPEGAWVGLALEAGEKARGRAMLDLLYQSGADLTQGVDTALLEREQKLRRLLSAKANRLLRLRSSSSPGPEADAIDREMDSLVKEHQQVEAEIRARSPRFASLSPAAPLSTSQIQTLIDSDTLLLEYALGNERSFVWLVGPHAVRVYELPPRARIEEAARRCHELFAAEADAARPNDKDRTTLVQRALSEVGEMLLGPVLGELAQKRLWFVPDGALHYVPFAALTHSSAPDRPLILDHEIVILPSASALQLLRQQAPERPRGDSGVMVFADPVFDADDPRLLDRRRVRPAETTAPEPAGLLGLRRSARDAGLGVPGGALPRLPYTRQEAQAILALAPAKSSRLALDFDASREEALRSDIARYRYVHFATHGILNSSNPRLSGIVLSLVDRQGQPRDGFLPAAELLNLPLHADLVVLSACRTALGKEIRGEGLVGLTRAFFYAGAQRVASSLWKVDDVATARLMTHFYRVMLREGQSPAAALRSAQIAMRAQERWRHPYYWAGFVLQGDWR